VALGSLWCGGTVAVLAANNVAAVTAVYAAILAVGVIAGVIAFGWARRTRHERRLWHNMHNTDTVAIVLELEECVRELEQTR